MKRECKQSTKGKGNRSNLLVKIVGVLGNRKGVCIKKTKKAAVMLALLLAGSTSALAGMTFSFNMDKDFTTAYSRVYTKTATANDAYMKQTGSTQGTYTVEYSVLTEDGTQASVSTLTLFGTDRAAHEMLYKTTYRPQYPINMKLKGRYTGNGIVLVEGDWNPVD